MTRIQEIRQEHAEAIRKAKEQETAEKEAREQTQRQERKRVCASLAGHGLFMLNIARHLLNVMFTRRGDYAKSLEMVKNLAK